MRLTHEQELAKREESPAPHFDKFGFTIKTDATEERNEDDSSGQSRIDE